MVFLHSRDELIQIKSSQIKFDDGGYVQYVNESALVCFSIVRHTCEIYLDVFPQSDHCHLVAWVDFCLLNFINQLRRHLVDEDCSFDGKCECVNITKRQTKTVFNYHT